MVYLENLVRVTLWVGIDVILRTCVDYVGLMLFWLAGKCRGLSSFRNEKISISRLKKFYSKTQEYFHLSSMAHPKWQLLLRESSLQNRICDLNFEYDTVISRASSSDYKIRNIWTYFAQSLSQKEGKRRGTNFNNNTFPIFTRNVLLNIFLCRHNSDVIPGENIK